MINVYAENGDNFAINILLSIFCTEYLKKITKKEEF